MVLREMEREGWDLGAVGVSQFHDSDVYYILFVYSQRSNKPGREEQ